MGILDIIANPLGKFLYFIYNTMAFHYYGLAIIIFTLIIKLVLAPLTVKQYRSSAKMQELQPLIQEVQKRYKNDKQKLNEEMMKVYKENNYNPAGGCLPLVLQMPIIISLYWVIVQPLKFMLGKTADQINNLVTVASKYSTAVKAVAKYTNQRELKTLDFFNNHQDKLNEVVGNLSKHELINFNFLGLHLGETPTYHLDVIRTNPGVYIPLLIIPIFAVITTYISTKLSMPKNRPNASSQGGAASSMSNTMMYIGPLMTLIFSFSLPAGVGLYWSVGYVFTIFQQLYINKNVYSKKEAPKAKTVTGGGNKKAISDGSGETAGAGGNGGNPGEGSGDVKANDSKGAAPGGVGNKQGGGGKNTGSRSKKGPSKKGSSKKGKKGKK